MRISQYQSQLNNSSQHRYLSKQNNTGSVSFGVSLAPIKKISMSALDAGTDSLARGFGALANFKPVQSLVLFLKNKNYEEHLAAFVGCVISGFYMLDTAKSKKIESDQKMPLIVNQGIVCGLSTVGAYTLNRYLNKKLNGLTETFHISQIQNKDLQNEFLNTKSDYNYINTFKEKYANKPVLNNIFKSIDSKLEFNNTVEVYIKDNLKKYPEDSVAKQFLEDIKKVSVQKGADKSEVLKTMFLEHKNSSKTLQEAYNRATMNSVMGKFAGIETIVNKMLSKIDKNGEMNIKKVAEYFNVEIQGAIAKNDKPSRLIIELLDEVKSIKTPEATESFIKALREMKGGRLTSMMNGFKVARALMVFAIIYRFVSPVFATPLANNISEFVENRKKAA